MCQSKAHAHLHTRYYCYYYYYYYYYYCYYYYCCCYYFYRYCGPQLSEWRVRWDPPPAQAP